MNLFFWAKPTLRMGLIIKILLVGDNLNQLTMHIWNQKLKFPYSTLISLSVVVDSLIFSSSQHICIQQEPGSQNVFFSWLQLKRSANISSLAKKSFTRSQLMLLWIRNKLCSINTRTAGRLLYITFIITIMKSYFFNYSHFTQTFLSIVPSSTNKFFLFWSLLKSLIF